MLLLISVLERMVVSRYYDVVLTHSLTHHSLTHSLTHLVLLQVLKGSHHAGRIAHIKVGDQVGADTDRVDQLMKVSMLVSPIAYLSSDTGTPSG